jgi:glucose 1-dehydrogenase
MEKGGYRHRRVFRHWAGNRDCARDGGRNRDREPFPIRERARAIAIAADISSEDQLEAMFAETLNRFSKLDILINNAGIERPAPIQDMTLADWRAVIDVNLTGQFLCSRAAVRAFLNHKNSKRTSGAIGTIIFVSSYLFMRSLAQELAPMKIRVNSVAPGAIRTPINHEAWAKTRKWSNF